MKLTLKKNAAPLASASMKTYGMEATSLFAFFRIVTSYILKGVLSSNMKLFRRYQQEILQRRGQECVNDLWKDHEKERRGKSGGGEGGKEGVRWLVTYRLLQLCGCRMRSSVMACPR